MALLFSARLLCVGASMHTPAGPHFLPFPFHPLFPATAADVEFGRIQARDLLQHLLTGPISNAPVDIVRGSKSIEVRPVGISKGSSMERILHVMAGAGSLDEVDFVFVGGHFLARDENIFTLFSGSGSGAQPGGQANGGGGSSPAARWAPGSQLALLDDLGDPTAIDRMPAAITPGRTQPAAPRRLSGTAASAAPGGTAEALPLALPPRALFTCTVGRSMASKAQYCLGGSMEVALLLSQLAAADGLRVEALVPPGLAGCASYMDLHDALLHTDGLGHGGG